jgi:hypothetical protein
VVREDAGAPALHDLRDDVIEVLRAQTAARALSLLGSRADG